ncbi:MAG: SRPBCC domain-containing protein [Xanthobacteraceae bacterium]
MNEPLVVRRETQVAAPPATVFAYLTDPDKIVSWVGAEAVTETRPGGLYLLKGVAGDPGRIARGAFREVVPVHRLAYTFGWEAGQEVPPGSSLIEIDLIERDGGTLVRLTHSGLPNASQCANHDRGWAHYMNRLTIAAGGGQPGADHGPTHP